MRVALVLLAGCALGRGPSQGDDTPPDAPPGELPIRSCTTHFHYRPDAPVTSVALAGEWDWTAREPLTDADGDGDYTLDKDLPTGLYAYKLVVDDATWILDPANPYRAYDSGVENSGVRVPDCSVPLVELAGTDVTADGAIVHLRLARGTTGAAITGVHAVVRHDGGDSDAPITGDTITLAGLAPGKYTVAIDASDAMGAAAERVLAPVWIEADKFDWRDAVIYMVMTDRFRNGDPANDAARTPAAVPEADYHGGDLRGVTAAIDDGTFDALGVRALWLSPFVENAQRVHYESGHGVTAYHGYWPVKARAVDPRLGSEADLDALVASAHRHGIRVLMDYVINHVHIDHEYYAAHPEWFRVGCTCGDPGCDWTEHRLDCSFHDYLPDVNWQRRDASEQMIADALYWLERFDLDGLRVDAVKHVEDLAIFNLSTRVHEKFEGAGTEYFLLGETAMGWNGDDLAANLPEYQTISRYIGDHALSGQFDFVLYHATTKSVFTDDTRGMLHLDYWTRESLANYPATAVMTPFVGSHDSERLISLATYGSSAAITHHKWTDEGLPAAPTTDEPYERAALALAWELTIPGAPLVYYGDEYGEHGGADPDNRHMWVAPAQRTARQSALYARIAQLGKLRAELAPLRRGSYQPLTVTEDVLSFARTYQDHSVVVVLNHAGAPRSQRVDVALPDGPLVDRVGNRTVMVTGGSFVIDMPARSVAVLAP